MLATELKSLPKQLKIRLKNEWKSAVLKGFKSISNFFANSVLSAFFGGIYAPQMTPCFFCNVWFPFTWFYISICFFNIRKTRRSLHKTFCLVKIIVKAKTKTKTKTRKYKTLCILNWGFGRTDENKPTSSWYAKRIFN